jgi:hypothetical protein
MLDRTRIAAALLLTLAAGPLRADVWDQGGDPDNSFAGTPDNELWHGVVQVHDLGTLPGPVADADHYGAYSSAFHSYEVQVTGTTGDLDNGGAPDFTFGRYDASAVLVQSFLPLSPLSFSRSIAWETGSSSFPAYLRVGDAACGTSCSTADQYTIRMYDTTYSIPRFNNSGTQVTTLIIQNVSNATVNGRIWYFDSAGANTAVQSLSLPPRNVLVYATTAIVPNQSGSILISHNGHYGSLSGKAVALEPATGFTFDTPLLAVPD